MRFEGHVARMGIKSNTFMVLIEKPGEKPPGSARGRLEVNIKWILWNRIGWFWIRRVVLNTTMNLLSP
jgi:hypothetical protein